MKKFIGVLIVITIAILSGCSNSNNIDESIIILPEISGLSRSEIEIIFADLEVDILFYEFGDATEANSFIFIEYGQFLQDGDEFSKDDYLPIITFPEYSDVSPYFEILNMVYDGPYLDESFSLIDPVDPRGGYFEVTLNYCIDGDTARFVYPQVIHDAIPNFSNNTKKTERCN